MNPSAPVGAWDVKPTPTGRILLDFARGRLPAFVDTGLNVIHAQDVAEGHLLAAERGRVESATSSATMNMTLAEILAEAGAVLGRAPPRVRLYFAALAVGALDTAVSRLVTTGRRRSRSTPCAWHGAHVLRSGKAVREPSPADPGAPRVRGRARVVRRAGLLDRARQGRASWASR